MFHRIAQAEGLGAVSRQQCQAGRGVPETEVVPADGTFHEWFHPQRLQCPVAGDDHGGDHREGNGVGTRNRLHERRHQHQGHPVHQVPGQIDVARRFEQGDQDEVDQETERDHQGNHRAPAREEGRHVAGAGRRRDPESAGHDRLEGDQAGHENVHADVQDHDPEGGPDRTAHHLFEGFALKQETDQGDEPDENGNLREKIVRQRRSDIGNEIH